MRDYAHVASRIYNTAVMLAEPKLQIYLNVISQRLGIDAPTIAADAADGSARRSSGAYQDAYDAGVLVMDVSGTLVNRYATAPSGILSYDEIRDGLNAAVANPKIKGVLMRCESYGGEVSGVWDACDAIRAAGQQKPIWAIADDTAYSAMFALFSQAQRRFMTRTAGVGSVGVIAVHYDFSASLKADGIKPTVIKFGAKKDQFSPLNALSESALAKLQAEVDASGETFVKYVSEALGISADAVRGTQADVFTAQQALDLKFVDAIATYEQVIAQMIEFFKPKALTPTFRGGSAAKSSKEQTMETPNPAENPNPPVDIAAIVAGARARVKAILTHAEADGRKTLAEHLAFNTEMSADEAGVILAASPKAVAAEPVKPQGKTEFTKAMEAAGNPDVKAGADVEVSSDEARQATAVAIYNRSRGIKA